MNERGIQDRVKWLYQRHFGGGHMIADPQAAVDRLAEECAALAPVAFEEPLFEPLGGGLCRMHLRPMMQTGLSPQTAAAMFVYSANHTQPDDDGFARALEQLAATPEEAPWLADYRAAGCPAISHSDAYREAYRPAYRVVQGVFAWAFPLIARMDAMDAGIVALDGPCASGKSTLAAALAAVFEANLFHMDDFFLQPRQRTPQRLAEPGGNVDRERFAQEVLQPLRTGDAFSYCPYDCGTQALAASVSVAPTPISIVEGAYSLHPALRDAYSLTAFLRIDPDTQRERLLRRNGEVMLRRFEAEWIPMEEVYFAAFDIPSHANVTLLPK